MATKVRPSINTARSFSAGPRVSYATEPPTKIAAIALLASAGISGYSSTSSAEICYDVAGSLTTENVTESLQIGNVSLILSDKSSGEEIISEKGSLLGNITGSPEFGVSTLSHKARFPRGDSFVTDGDKARITDILGTNQGSIPRAFNIDEKITDVVKGTRFFKNFTSVNVTALGTVSNCPGLNENSFDLSDELCVE